MKPRVIRQGDTVASVVGTAADPDAVWNDPANDSLRALRKDPAVLCPGDVLQVPETEPIWHTIKPGSSTTFVAPVATQRVDLVLAFPAPLANAAYVVKGLGDDRPGTTGADGSLSVDVPVDRDSFLLELVDQKTTLHVLVGHLDPIDEESGVRQRLANMGFASPLEELLGLFHIEVPFRSAIRGFQERYGHLRPTGELDADTCAAIQRAHGV
jgi:hypothetical protein